MGDHAPTGRGHTTRAHPGSRSRKRPSRLVRDDRGSAELVVATPLLLLLILGVIQFALYEHASEVAQTSAAQALAATRVLGGTTTSGRNEAESLLSSVGRGVLINPVVSDQPRGVYGSSDRHRQRRRDHPAVASGGERHVVGPD